MKAEEILALLINKGIVHRIGDEYIPTSVVSELTANIQAPNELNIGAVNTIRLEYPKEIIDVSDNAKAKAVMMYCMVPATPPNNNRTYFLRTVNKASNSVILDIMANPSIEPELLLNSIVEYYKLMEYPKSFANYVNDGDILEVYSIYKKGDSLGGEEIPSNLQWI